MAGKISVLRLGHLYPGLGVSLLGDGTLGGAMNAFNSAGGGINAFAPAATEFANDLSIAYLGYKPTDGSTWFTRGYPFKTYALHAGIELAYYFIKRFVHKEFKLGPFKFP